VNGTNGHAKAPQAAPSTNGGDGGKDPVTGRFVAGNRLSRGNPHFRTLAANRSAILKVVGPEQVEQLTRALLCRALDGDLDAARVLLSYSVGRPGGVVDPDAQDADELQRLLGRPLAMSLAMYAMEAVGIADAIAFLQKVAEGKQGQVLGEMDRGKFVLLDDLRRAANEARVKTS
jgi:hypothetical protein